jgi:hypothetical protein
MPDAHKKFRDSHEVITLYFSEQDKRYLKVAAFEADLTMTEYVRRAIKYYHETRNDHD